MNNKPFFSIIIPALNEEKYLPKLLDDLTKQTYQDFEAIIVDGKSDDKTEQKALEYSNKLKITVLTSNRRHVCTQRNIGAKKATGEVLIFSDADNRFDPSFLIGLKYRWETSQADIIAPWIKSDIPNSQNNAIATAINYFLELQSQVNPYFLLESLICIKKDTLNKLGGFDENTMYAEGKNLIKSAVDKGYKYKIIRDPMYAYSFRRLRHVGILKSISNVVRLETSSFLGLDKNNDKYSKYYPMLGGGVFSKSKREKSKFIKSVSKIIKKIQEL